jgi:hypothetical protein
MWGKPKAAEVAASVAAQAGRLKDAIRQTRIEVAEKSDAVAELRDAELVRLELLNDALDPVFADIAPEIDLFDRGISRGDTPRLWIDAIAHVAMAHDKRCYRFLQDTRYGRKILAEGNEIEAIVGAVTHYVAARIIEREQALAADLGALGERMRRSLPLAEQKIGWRLVRAFLFGLVMGCAALFAALWIVASRLPH